jgi:Uma2 family endonuclease
MVVAQEQAQTITVEAFWEMAVNFPEDKRYELVAGEIIEMPPPSRLHSEIAALIASFIIVFARQNKLGHVFGADGFFALTEQDVRIPDVSFVSASRDVDVYNRKAIFAPDLAVEVISPSERPGRSVTEKTTLYLNSGVTVVWNVYIEEQIIEVWRKGSGDKLEVEILRRDTILTTEDVLPGFTLALADVFPAVDDEEAPAADEQA